MHLPITYGRFSYGRFSNWSDVDNMMHVPIKGCNFSWSMVEKVFTALRRG